MEVVEENQKEENAQMDEFGGSVDGGGYGDDGDSGGTVVLLDDARVTADVANRVVVGLGNICPP